MSVSKELYEDKDWASTLEGIPGAASLLKHIDKKIFVWLRDGRTFVGYLRSVDQFANLLLYSAVERIQISDGFGDIPQGILIVRGENVVLLGECGKDKGKRYQAEQLLSGIVDRDDYRKKMDKLKLEAAKKKGLVYSFDDRF